MTMTVPKGEGEGDSVIHGPLINLGLLNAVAAATVKRATPSNPLSILDNTNIDKSGCSLSCPAASVLDILQRRPELFSFKETCALFSHRTAFRIVEETFQLYAVLITGLPECAVEDLPLAVYFFIEDVFGIEPKIEFCTKMHYGKLKAVGVVFDSVTTTKKIGDKLKILEGSGISISKCFKIGWILDALSEQDDPVDLRISGS